MCSTPRPRTKVKGKAGTSGSLLSNMSPEARSRFAERANVAQQRRHQMTIKTQQNNRQQDAAIITSKKAVNRVDQKSQHNVRYWLVSASLKEIFMMLFFSKSKRI